MLEAKRGRGRPVGAVNRSGEPTRSSSRQRQVQFDMSDVNTSARTLTSANKAARQQRERRQANQASSGKPSGASRKRKRPRQLSLSQSRSKKRRERRRRFVPANERTRQKRDFANAVHTSLLSVVRSELDIEQLRLLALMAFYWAVGQFGYTRTGAANSVSTLFVVHPNTVLFWARMLEIEALAGEVEEGTADSELVDRIRRSNVLSESLRGKHQKTLWLLEDPELQSKARQWLRERSVPEKGRPNLKAREFRLWVNENILKVTANQRGISKSTACVWLHRLGWEVTVRAKGISFDAHEREDVVSARAEYVAALAALLHAASAKPPARLYSDQSAFNSFDAESWCWSEGGKAQAQMKSKDRGKSLMAMDFLSWEKGLLPDARLLLEIGTQGYMDNDRVLKQVYSC